MVASPSQRWNEPQSRQAHQHPVKVGYIFGPVEGAHPTLTWIPEGEPSLQTSDPWMRCRDSPECGGRPKQLINLWPVLGIVDNHDLTGCIRITEIARLRLGTRSCVGHHNYPEVARQPYRRRGRPGLSVVLF